MGRKNKNAKKITGKYDLLFLYGVKSSKKKPAIYCTLHKCYVEPKQITEKGCHRKKCKYRSFR